MNKATGGDITTVEPFQILTHDAVKVLHSVCQQIWKTYQWLMTKKPEPNNRSNITTNSAKTFKKLKIYTTSLNPIQQYGHKYG